ALRFPGMRVRGVELESLVQELLQLADVPSLRYNARALGLSSEIHELSVIAVGEGRIDFDRPLGEFDAAVIRGIPAARETIGLVRFGEGRFCEALCLRSPAFRGDAQSSAGAEGD